MDPKNLFATPTTYWHLRAEFGLGMVTSALLLALHRKKVRILPAALLFAYADAVGYIPGAIAFRRHEGGRISRTYYRLYNIMHSGLTGAVVAALWARKVKPEWALLAIPLHLCGDRALFGNMAKPFSVAFEPHPHPVYERVRELLELPAEQLASDAVTVSNHPTRRATNAAGRGSEASASA